MSVFVWGVPSRVFLSGEVSSKELLSGEFLYNEFFPVCFCLVNFCSGDILSTKIKNNSCMKYGAFSLTINYHFVNQR